MSTTLPSRVAEPGMSDEAIKKGSGKSWDEWFALLDAWGAMEKTHTEIARHISEELGIDGWWAQGVTVGYERARGMRAVNQTLNGFVMNASKMVNIPVNRLYAAFVDESNRDRWLEPGTLRLRTSQENRSARFDILTLEGSLLEVNFTAKSIAKSSAALQQGKLSDDEERAIWKTFWKERLERLAALLRRIEHVSGPFIPLPERGGRCASGREKAVRG
jgi:hypothetical protein